VKYREKRIEKEVVTKNEKVLFSGQP
jgi:hypothetical protein